MPEPGGGNGGSVTLLGLGGGEDCYPYFTGEGTLDFFGFLQYVNEFNDQTDRADCTGDGAFDFFDFLCFLNAFDAGC